jgi:ribosome-interacting GTPase 1
LLDLPGIIEGAATGKGRGRQVIAVARNANLILMMLDAEKAAIQRVLLTKELESVGIRVNKRPPNVTFVRKTAGGIGFNSMVPLTKDLDEKLARRLCQLYKVRNAQILIKEDITSDDFIDVLEGNRVYIRCLYCCNKVDNLYLGDVDRLAHMDDTVCISVHHDLNIDYVLDKIWEYLDFIRVYTKKRGARPSFDEPLILRRGSIVQDLCDGIHRNFSMKYALVWGTSAKHMPQRVGSAHVLEDEDVCQLMQ